MKKRELLEKLAGLQTIESAMDILKADKRMAIYYICRLRKEGYVKTKRQSNNRRVYNISLDNKLRGKSYYDIINLYSPIKISSPVIYKLYGLAKENNIERQAGALYDTARQIMKVRRMTHKFRNNALPKEGHRFEY